jgi:putative tryptophan/tyrosine transport system substrate-binding protein
MNRREFTAGLGGAAAWPVVVRAQQPERVRRIGVLFPNAVDDPEKQTGLTAFLQGLQELGWTVGPNVRIDYRWYATDADSTRKNAAELVALRPDVILVPGGFGVRALQQATSSIPIVFAAATDPVGGDLVASLAKPDGNTTGFTSFEYGIGAKWLEVLKEVAPKITRVAVLRDPIGVGGGGQLGAIQAVAPSFGVEVRPVGSREADGIVRALNAFAAEEHGGVIVTWGRLAEIHRDLIITLAARHRLPTIYPSRNFIVSGGLISYGPDAIDQYRRVAGYVDRILKGEKPGDLPVQAPTKYQLVINLKTAKALGLEVPQSLLARADEVIE